MSTPFEDLFKQNIELMNRFIAENDELDRAFRKETLGEFISSHIEKKEGEDDETRNQTEQLERKVSTDDVGRESGRASREPAAGEAEI